MDNQVKGAIEVYAGIIQEENTQKCIWLRNSLFLSTTLFGILVSLQSTTPYNRLSFLCFFLANILLLPGIACMCIALYNLSVVTARKLREACRNELKAAMYGDTKVVEVYPAKYVLFCEKAAYVCIAVALLLLLIYSLSMSVYKYSGC